MIEVKHSGRFAQTLAGFSLGWLAGWAAAWPIKANPRQEIYYDMTMLDGGQAAPLAKKREHACFFLQSARVPATQHFGSVFLRAFRRNEHISITFFCK